jgi:hypothetical protein
MHPIPSVIPREWGTRKPKISKATILYHLPKTFHHPLLSIIATELFLIREDFVEIPRT